MIFDINGYKNYLNELIKEIDVSDTDYENAERSYKSLSNWLQREQSILNKYEPDIFIQGSFKLGTAINPITDEGNFDLDIVCKLNKLGRKDITQKELKKELGTEVISYSEAKSMKNDPKDGKRCWTINYSEGSKFHIDILPCISETNLYSEDLVYITDKKNPFFNTVSSNWEVSNPKGYYKWFQEVSKYNEYRATYAEAREMSIEDIPIYKVRNPLQRVIQLLKRHAEYAFETNQEYKPSSIVITTLAAQAFKDYRGNNSLFDLWIYTCTNINDYLVVHNNKYFVTNPANDKENFTEKWEHDNKYYENYKKWHIQLLKDFGIMDSEFGLFDGIKMKESLKINKRINSTDQNSYNIPHRRKPNWVMRDEQVVTIKGFKRRDGFRYREFNSGDIVNPNWNLKFEIYTENIRSFDIFWQVTNTGSQARKKNSLRGDFYDSEIEEGKRVRKEDALYVGSHLVEVYIVKNGICYGKSKPFLVNISNNIFVF
ncbi:nucleotidyltransferase [Marinilactibacillus sp. Marseille-P9653]|uniref:nucleotidyltransferase n=1 Tax=Marinilactibacillus sp. Marseille-P9653 TaxID=2866583 RepID=UPI001CE472BE|nr:nucleotidyltransferase [Marinilactibacillus sp. Marseille-P9653]